MFVSAALTLLLAAGPAIDRAGAVGEVSSSVAREVPARFGGIGFAAFSSSPVGVVQRNRGALDDLEVTSAENLRASPNGERIGRLEAGTRVRSVSVSGPWREVELEGWVWTRSLQVVDRGGYDLVVAVDGGENVRAAPGGEVLGLLVEGALLREEERVPGWIRVTRRAWIWGASVRALPGAEAGAGAGVSPQIGPENTPGASDATELDTSAAAARDPEPGAAAVDAVSRAPDAARAVGEARSASAPLELRADPAGPRVADVAAGAALEVTEVEGDWARVRIEGWVPLAELGAEGTSTSRGLHPTDVTRMPERWVGRPVTWTLEFVGVERADERRPDFAPGEPFLLMRAAAPAAAVEAAPDGAREAATARSFVYVAVSEAQLAELGTLAPLARVTVTGRVRSGASRWTRTPIIELASWRRESSR